MAAATGWNRLCRDDSSLNQTFHPFGTPLFPSMLPSAHSPSVLASGLQEERKLPPISNAVYSSLRALHSPESTIQQSPAQVANALPPVSQSPAAPDARQRYELSQTHVHDASSLRRLSLPPLVYDRGLGEHSNLKLRMKHMPTRSPEEQHQSNGLRVQSKRHMSAADLHQVTALVRGPNDWAVGQSLRTITDEVTPSAAQRALYSEGSQSDKLHAVVQAIVSELAVVDDHVESTGSRPLWLTKVRTIDETEAFLPES